MKKHDCVVIGDSMVAIHAALQFSGGDFTVLLIRPDISPVEVFDSEKGAFECDMASGCDLGYYFGGDDAGELYGYRDKFDLLNFPYRTKTPNFSFNEPGDDSIFVMEVPKQFPNYNNAIMGFYTRISHLHDIVDEIEIKTGLIPRYPETSGPRLFTQLDPLTFSVLTLAMNTSFRGFLAKYNLPEELLTHYTLMCSDHLGLSPESIDTMMGAELITRRRHGLNRPKGGWLQFRDKMLETLRNRRGVTIIGGKKIDLVKSSAGFVYEVYVDERDAHPVDWLVIDESIGMLGFEGSQKAEGRFSPLGFYSTSHLDFKLCLGWEEEPPKKWPSGVNFLYSKTEFPPQAPHMVRVDVMPPQLDDQHGLKSKMTIRGKYPVERIISSWGEKVNDEDLKAELMSAVKDMIPLPESEPSFVKLILPKNYNDPFKESDKALFSPMDFRHHHKNVRLINMSGISGGSMRLAFRSAERIADEIKRKISMRNFFEEIALKPIIIYPGFDETVSPDPKR